mmetsp:Transcript_136879/g.273011  ORF Transcript_136879/g.273011 Transcript_136879/m.273011 type:complete len:117 (-) Transcript_136879:130-480(-)
MILLITNRTGTHSATNLKMCRTALSRLAAASTDCKASNSNVKRRACELSALAPCLCCMDRHRHLAGPEVPRAASRSIAWRGCEGYRNCYGKGSQKHSCYPRKKFNASVTEQCGTAL